MRRIVIKVIAKFNIKYTNTRMNENSKVTRSIVHGKNNFAEA